MPTEWGWAASNPALWCRGRWTGFCPQPTAGLGDSAKGHGLGGSLRGLPVSSVPQGVLSPPAVPPQRFPSEITPYDDHGLTGYEHRGEGI